MAELLIKDWEQGMADSRVSGPFADIRCVDIYSEPGLLKSAFLATKYSSTTITDFVKWMDIREGQNQNIYAFGDANKLYTASSPVGSWSHVTGNTTSAGSGNGMKIWKGYVFTARNTALDLYSIGGAAWSNSWAGLTLESDTYHPMFVGQDDILYIGNGRYVASVQEVAGSTFDPANGATYVATAQALDLPSNYRVRCLAELGQSLMIGTWQGLATYDKKIADIFPWDRVSSSFDFPTRLNENGVLQMLNVDNIIYAVAGIEHNIYRINGTTSERLRGIPRQLWDIDGGKYTEAYPQAIAPFQGRVLTGSAAGSGTESPMGIFSVTPDGRLSFENQSSAGSAATTSIGALLSTGAGGYLISWKDTVGPTYGIDYVGNDGRITTAATTSVKSQMYAVGTKKQPAIFNDLEIQLAQPLATGQSVVVQYRTDTSAAFTNLATFDFTTYGAVQSYCEDIGLTDIENIQINLQITSGANTSTLKLYYVKLFDQNGSA